MILIVDDEPSNLELLCSIIEGFEDSVEVMQTTSARQALDIAAAEFPDLIITDWEMPEMTGIELIKTLKANPETEHIPIIMCTGVMVSPKHLMEALNAGAMDYVRKPLDPIELEARINSMLQLAQSQELVRMQIAKLAEQQANREDFLTNKLELKDKDLSELALVISRQKEMAKGLLTRMKSLKKGGESPAEAFNQIVLELQIRIQDDEATHLVGENIETLTSEFFRRLHERFPDLTKSELELCSLTLMNYSTQSMALMRNVEVNSIRKSRQRMRKKMGLEPSVNLLLFLKSI